jgi:PleD family two-component response regulator
MLTSHGNAAVDLAALDAGANDYLVKGKFDMALLDRTMRYATHQARIVTDLARRLAEQEEIVRTLQDGKRRSRRAQADLQRGNVNLERRVSDRTAEVTRLYQSIARTEERLREATEAPPGGIVTIDGTGAIGMVDTRSEAPRAAGERKTPRAPNEVPT